MSLGGRGQSGPPPDLLVAERAARQEGRIRFDQLVACGLDDAAVARRVAKGQLHREHRGVYAVGYRSDGFYAQVMAAVLAGGEGAVASHWTAAAVHGFVRWDGRPIDVTVRNRAGRARPGIRFHRPRRLAERDTTRCHGIPTTTAARALLEITPQLSDRRLRRAVRQAQAEEAANVRQIADVLRRANGHRGTRRLATIIATGPAPTFSGDEDVVLDLLLEAGIARPDVNRRLVVGVETYYPDMRWPAERLILEVDSGWHEGPLAQHDDALRQGDLEAAGERVLRTTLEQAVLDPRQLIRRLAAAGAPYTDPQP
jgi:hypothetical protein